MVADTAAPYLLALRLDGRRVLVAGGGSVAARRVPGLLGAGADVLLVSPEVTPSLHDLILAGRIGWQSRGYAPGDCAGAWLVCACTDDPGVNAAVAAEAEAAGIWSVRADDAAASAAWTPASGHAGDLRFGVVSGDPQRSAGIRDAVLAGLQDGSLRTRRRRRGGRVALVGGGPGDPGLITVRGRQLLAEADVVVADRLAPRALLDELGPDVELVDAAKIPRGRAMTQEDINSLLTGRARQGLAVVRLKGGDPFVFGRGGEEVLACLADGIPVTVVPGVTSAVGVPGAAGHPGHPPRHHPGVPRDFGTSPTGRPALHGGLGRAGHLAGHAGAPDGPGAPEPGGRDADPGWPGFADSSFGHCGRYPADAAHNYHRAQRRSRSGQCGRPAPASNCRDR